MSKDIDTAYYVNLTGYSLEKTMESSDDFAINESPHYYSLDDFDSFLSDSKIFMIFSTETYSLSSELKILSVVKKKEEWEKDFNSKESVINFFKKHDLYCDHNMKIIDKIIKNFALDYIFIKEEDLDDEFVVVDNSNSPKVVTKVDSASIIEQEKDQKNKGSINMGGM